MVETARQSQIFSENRWQDKKKNRPKPPMLGIIGKIYEVFHLWVRQGN